MLQTSNSLPTGTYTATLSVSSPTIIQSVIVDVTVTNGQGGLFEFGILLSSVAVAAVALVMLTVWRRRLKDDWPKYEQTQECEDKQVGTTISHFVRDGNT